MTYECEKIEGHDHTGEATVQQACFATTDLETFGGCAGKGVVNVPVSHAGEDWLCGECL